MLKRALIASLSSGLHALFSTAPWATQRLTPFSGSEIAFDLGGIVVPITIREDGFPRLAESLPASPDLTIRMPWSALLMFPTDQAAALRQVHMEGNTGLATEVGFLARHFRPDLEELLSRVVGDIAAHRLSGLARAGKAWARDSSRRIAESCAEYVTEEARLVATRSSLKRFAGEVEQLAQSVQRLERRLSGRI